MKKFKNYGNFSALAVLSRYFGIRQVKMRINPIQNYFLAKKSINFKGKKENVQIKAEPIKDFAPKNLNVYSFMPVKNICFKGNAQQDVKPKFDLFYDDKNNLAPVVPYQKGEGKFDPEQFLADIRYENQEKKYIKIYREQGKEPEIYFAPNKEAQDKLQELDSLSIDEKREFINAYCKETGFPDLKLVKQKQEAEIKNALHSLAEKYNFDVMFIGYDKNCSMGRGIPLPGSDCDALYMIIDDTNIDKNECAGSIRWKFKDVVNQRLLSTHSMGLPDLLPASFIEEGLALTDSAFKSANFKMTDLIRFKKNEFDSSKDFVKAGEFDIKLAQELPDDEATRDKFYKTAMFVELVREGVVLENNFSPEFIAKIKKSPLYKYSNIIRQKGLGNLPKNKHIQRKNMPERFSKMNTDEQFDMIRDMLHSSLYLKDAKNRDLFVNESTQGANEMGNILDLYDMLQHSKK